jgi:hypothetical protein
MLTYLYKEMNYPLVLKECISKNLEKNQFSVLAQSMTVDLFLCVTVAPLHEIVVQASYTSKRAYPIFESVICYRIFRLDMRRTRVPMA